MKKEDYISASVFIEKLAAAKKELIASGSIMDKKDYHPYPIENPPFPIPEHWDWAYLSDVSVIQEGPGIRKHQYQTEGIQFLTVTNILEGAVDLLKSQKYVSKEEYDKKYQHFTINQGDIVTACSGASWGKSAIYDCPDKLMLNTSTLRLRFFNDLGANIYLYYLTKSDYFKANLSSHSTGQQPNYGYSHYSKILIPIPPVQEQYRIASDLDHISSAIDQAKANLEKNIENAKELFQSKLNEIFAQKDEGWEEKSLEELATIKSGGTPSRAKLEYWDNDSIAWYSSGELNDLYTTEPMRYITNIGLENSNAKLFPKGSLLIGMYDTAALKMSIIDRDATFNQAICGLEPNEKINLTFILHAINAIKPEILKLRRGVRQKNLNQKKIKQIKISIPNRDAQNAIVNKLELFYNTIEELNNRNFEKLNYLSELKKSILQKAFAGELTKKEVKESVV